MTVLIALGIVNSIVQISLYILDIRPRMIRMENLQSDVKEEIVKFYQGKIEKMFIDGGGL